ncbi:hypothetical protein N7447_010535 [Penicillium robsamsonii]|uniref:uncharacterized protein n=1 Tax=Penicillium robsamsonii TaxID=1792511 RepID=UPI002549BF3E|nr:uncharacterized protein N7447_010535 [Penicillium robsamsonii]KAJ5811019.1 hypothetical protein N7447_010535 [Penicillium robsamsonii]
MKSSPHSHVLPWESSVAISRAKTRKAKQSKAKDDSALEYTKPISVPGAFPTTSPTEEPTIPTRQTLPGKVLKLFVRQQLGDLAQLGEEGVMGFQDETGSSSGSNVKHGGGGSGTGDDGDPPITKT